MAMYSGSFSSMSDLLGKFLGHLGDEGFAITAADAVYGATVAIPGAGSGVVTITAGTYELRLLAADSGRGTLAGAAGTMVNSAAAFALMAYARNDLTINFPGTYWVSIFDDPAEVWLVVEVDDEYYLWCGFGRSNVPGLASHGAWVCAIRAPVFQGTSRGMSYSASNGVAGGVSASPLPFTRVPGNPVAMTAFRDGFEGRVWSSSGVAHASEGMAPLLANAYSPNVYNGEAVLLPLNVYVDRAASYISLVAKMANIRVLKINNYNPKDVITLGHDDWIIFPGFRKNAAGHADSIANADHSGLFGLALRYEL